MEDASALCLDCGLCCDGTLFERVAIDDESLAAVEAMRLPLVRTADGVRMPLPCQAADGVRCRIYEQRPTRCREYVCELRSAVTEGRVSLPYARTIIDEVRALRAELTPAMPEGLPWWTVLARLRRAGPKARPALRRRLESLERILEARFWQ